MDISRSNKVKASIDIGSNTVLALAGEIRDDKVVPLLEMQEAPRLGGGVDEEKQLNADAVERVINALLSFKKFFKLNYPQLKNVKVMATSAVRDAQNKQQFVEKVENETGYKTRILSGEQEAKLMYLGAQSVLSISGNPLTVIDIGGGSSEVATGKGQNLTGFHSFNMGSVRFTERYLSGNPPAGEEIENCCQAVEQMLRQAGPAVDNTSTLVGIAGTLTSIASIDSELQTYQPKKLNGYNMTLTDISSHIERMSTQTEEQLLERHPEILEGRAEVILGGLLILETFMRYHQFDSVTISTGGIRHGALIKDSG